MHFGPSLRRRLRLAVLSLMLIPGLFVTGGCGSPEEPSEIPASPPPGKGLPKFAVSSPLPPRALG